MNRAAMRAEHFVRCQVQKRADSQGSRFDVGRLEQNQNILTKHGIKRYCSFLSLVFYRRIGKHIPDSGPARGILLSCISRAIFRDMLIGLL